MQNKDKSDTSRAKFVKIVLRCHNYEKWFFCIPYYGILKNHSNLGEGFLWFARFCLFVGMLFREFHALVLSFVKKTNSFKNYFVEDLNSWPGRATFEYHENRVTMISNDSIED